MNEFERNMKRLRSREVGQKQKIKTNKNIRLIIRLTWPDSPRQELGIEEKRMDKNPL